ncbi:MULTISPECIES: hypothetical protein [unclassified Corynebacterium]|uniref:hypothetical protein n=1 Tax=unclassified Corynebacterium TaxID=2624378 RepID=UPI0029CA5A0F|nr:MULTISPECIES: hypothetical protein [unclassified Corynebacterium]WPF66395.1 hypothetical protein OLX12_01305 [Corynebacterium sp. 22KM0430]WPF68885.1 hypothetical protein OLW90_01305 [Corynebacterium sp. 21KM1197]
MAYLQITDTQVTITLDWWEKIAAHRSHLTVPVRAIVGARAVDDVFALPEIKSAAQASGPGVSATRIKGLTTTGTFHTPQGTVFAVCHSGSGAKGGRAGLVIALDKATVDYIVVTTPLARRYAAQLDPQGQRRAA